MLYIELDKAEPVIEELLPLLAHKQPKIIAATLSALTAIIHAYGCKTVEPKPIIKTLPKMYGHADKNVRAEAQNLTVELYRWLKEAMKPLFWGELKPVQQQDLEKLFEKVKDEPAPKQERLLRSQQAVQEAAAEAGEAPEGGDPEEEAAEIDLEPEFMAIDVFEKVPKDFQDRLASSKWKDRKEALDELYTAVNVPAIEEGPFDEIMRGCAKSMKDANIAVVTVAANCVECIAKGLRKKFARYRSTILTPMLERFKEKKQSVTDAIAAACDAVFTSTGLTEILEEVLEALKNKNPQVKLESTRFLARSLKTTKEAPQPPEVKSIAEAATKLLSDAQATQRDAAAEVLGVLWKIMGDRNMLMHLESLDEIRKTKIKEFCDSAEVKAKWKPKAAPPPKPAAAPAAKKVVGKRPPASVKKPAPTPRPISPAEEPTPAPLAARPTSRPANKLAAPKSGLQPPAGGLKKPGLARPGIATAGSSVSSPRKPSALPIDEEAPIAPPRGLTAPGRGLASRPLGKVSSGFEPMEQPAPTPSHAPSSALSFAERAELSDLRAEADLLRQQNSDLRTDKMRQQSQIHELQNQNAQLIEDHTRDMLSLRAKEAQLTRARSDFEEANERANSFGREIERHKREIQRLGRQQESGRESPNYNDTHQQPSYSTNMDPPRSTALNGHSSYARPTYSVSRSQTIPNTTPKSAYNNNHEADSNGFEGEGKENVPDSSGKAMYGHKLNPSAETSESLAPQPHDANNSGTASPALQPRVNSSLSSGSAGTGSRANSLNRSQSDGVESWRRAAEVTQNLKARIEMMKVST